MVAEAISDFVALVVKRLGAWGDGIADHDGEHVFLPFTAPGNGFGRGSASAAAAGGKAGSSNGSPPGPGAASPPADISASAAAARCSISM